MKKTCSWVLMIVACFLSVLLSQRAIYALSTFEDRTGEMSEEDLHYYSDNGIYFINPCNNEGAKSSSCVGTLPGSNTEEKIWNYFVEANIDGISNNPAAIAGIMGNFKQESEFNPFATTGIYYGIFQTPKENLHAVDEAGLGQYWGSSSAPDDAIQKAVELELNYLTQENPRFRGEGDWQGKGFLTFINEAENTPEAYSDLFLVTYEDAYTENATSPHMAGVSNALEDKAAKKASESIYGRIRYYQEAGKRREYARELYDKYASSGTCISGGGFNGKELTWEDLNPLTANDRLKLLVETYGEYAMQLQKYYGVPWEMPFAVMVYKTQVGTIMNDASLQIQQAGNFNIMGLTNPVSGEFEEDMYRLTDVGDDGCFKDKTSSDCYSAYKSISKMLLGYTIYHARSGFKPNDSYDAGLKLLKPNDYQLDNAIPHFMETYCSGGCYKDEIIGMIRPGGDTKGWSGILDVVKEKGWKNSEELAKEWNIQPGGIATQKWGWGDIRREIWDTYGETGLPSNATTITGAVSLSNSSTSQTNNSTVTASVAGNAVLHAPENPWLENAGLEGYIKNEINLNGTEGTHIDDSAVENGQYLSFASDAGAGSGLPGFIILHLTSADNFGARSWTNYCGPGTGQSFYCPPHFTIDVKKREVFQHFPLSSPSAAVRNRGEMRTDRYGIQIEIVGHGGIESNEGTCMPGACSSEYLYTNFSDEDWDYIAKLLVAISNETGIPLTSSVKWPADQHEAETQMMIQSDDELKSYIGVLGHMHVNDKWDPLAAWTYIEPALQRIGYSYNNYGGNGNLSCDGDSSARPISGKCFQLENETDGGCTDDEFTYFRQCGDSWRDVPFGSCGTTCSSGCGPIAVAAVITALTGNLVTPAETTPKAGALGAHLCGEGAIGSITVSIVKDYGLNYEFIPNESVTVQNVDKWLDEGKMMVFSVGSELSPKFIRADGSEGAENITRGAHYIAIRGKAANGYYYTFDSAGDAEGTKDRNNRAYEPNDLLTLYKMHGKGNFHVISR